VVRSVAVEARQTDDPRVAVEGDPASHRRDCRVSLPNFAGVIEIGKQTLNGVLVWGFPRRLLAPEQVGLGELAGGSTGAVEAQ